MFIPAPAPPTQLTRFKTEVSFSAEDPWNGNLRGTFLLDDYVLTLRGAKTMPDGALKAPWRGGFHRALRSEADGVTRFLPESLIELWLTKQAPTEALPGLLKQIEPSLRNSDYRPMLRSRTMKLFAVFETVCCTGMVFVAIAAVVLAHAPWLTAVATVLGTAAVCWGFLYLVYFGRFFRRKRQMQWLLDRIQANHRSATDSSVQIQSPEVR